MILIPPTRMLVLCRLWCRLWCNYLCRIRHGHYLCNWLCGVCLRCKVWLWLSLEGLRVLLKLLLVLLSLLSPPKVRVIPPTRVICIGERIIPTPWKLVYYIYLPTCFFYSRHNWTNISAMVHCVTQCTHCWGFFWYNCGGLSKYQSLHLLRECCELNINIIFHYQLIYSAYILCGHGSGRLSHIIWGSRTGLNH